MESSSSFQAEDNGDKPTLANQDSPLFLSQGSPESSVSVSDHSVHQSFAHNRHFAIFVPPVQKRSDYRLYEEEEEEEEAAYASEVLKEYEDSNDLKFLVRLSDGYEKKFTYENLMRFQNGSNALSAFKDTKTMQSDSTSSTPPMRRFLRKASRQAKITSDYVDISQLDLSSDDELTSANFTQPTMPRNRRLLGAQKPRLRRRVSDSQRSSSSMSSHVNSTSESFDTDDPVTNRRQRFAVRFRSNRSTRSRVQDRVNYTEPSAFDEDERDEAVVSTIQSGKRKRGRPRLRRREMSEMSPDAFYKTSQEPIRGERRSERHRIAQNDMREIGEDDIPDSTQANASVKASGAREHYQELPRDSDFRLRHYQTCDTCNEDGDIGEKGHLIYCQGCTLSYHQKCLGPRTTRDHLVTKVSEKNFVLQCRRCIGTAQIKDSLAPRHGQCTICHQEGEACKGFRDRKTSRQEQKDREDNDGEDPITNVPSHLINNVENVLFRCIICYRAYHVYHLPPKGEIPSITGRNNQQVSEERLIEYFQDWTCRECTTPPGEVESLVAWRPVDQDSYKPGITLNMIREDEKEYLTKWKNKSYFRSSWMPGAWVWGMTAPAMRKAFAKRENENDFPKMRTEDAIPEDYLRVDIVLNVEYTNVVNVNVEKVDLARIKEVKQALVKFKGLGYEDAVWEAPPEREDTQRWDDFKVAYEDWVCAKYIHPLALNTLSSHLSKVRAQNFEKKIMMHAQPENLVGGNLMEYQLEGLNWLYYRWHQRQNAILADEMGLGKTIQIIGFLAALQTRHKCWPFLIVVPNSTCPNWRREIKQWAPSLRVVAYYGSAEARKLCQKYELFPGSSKDLRCHVVITSYEAAQHEDFRKIFRGMTWQGLVVDEGQRLKNDKNILYEALSALRTSFKVLLTGTPLQNNPRELFNLLQFLDKGFDAQAMETEYADLTKDNVPQLHELLRKFLLRRTKAQVLSFLPSMAQIIVPLTMSVVQKKLYKSILAKNSELIRSIFGGSQRLAKQSDRANLNNILMQLRKCLSHPFVYSKAIEERNSNAAISHRNLVEASSKLQLLELMLPKLEERGHRVLIFSQFLDMLDIIEDFLDGLGLYYQRLDGSVTSLQKQKRIDEFNAPGSPLFAFLLSTRAGGVGINLATADTVIILDPDFNPHQDIQALSRAHRIGQQKKVLVFQLVTRGSAEEKIMQIGKKKMALDHVVIEQMGAAEDDAGVDLESILRHGTEALFKDDETHDIHYDALSVDKLLDRSRVENTQLGNDTSAESQFSFARVWVNDKSTLQDGLEDTSDNDSSTANLSTWENILKAREREVAEEAIVQAEAFGRGKRKRQTVDYTKQDAQDPGAESPTKHSGARNVDKSGSDTDFQARDADSDDEDSEETEEDVGVKELLAQSQSLLEPRELQHLPRDNEARTFKRARMPLWPHDSPINAVSSEYNPNAPQQLCIACNSLHPVGFCPLKLAGVEYCGLCGIAHYGYGSRNCPHLQSVTQCRDMLKALKSSTEPQTEKDLAKKYLVNLVGHLNRKKKPREANVAESANIPNSTIAPETPQPALPPVGSFPNQGFYPHLASGHPPGMPHVNGSGSGKENRPAGPQAGHF